ncbi:D-alanine--D-alanine ligase [Candidatus Parcubacteria bacterium]|nr:MAG: D-alanine--D-alanine ligase [Candidatus Parcubacteria bacterium]
MSKIKIAVICGGISPERDISLKGAQNVISALEAKGYETLRYDAKDDLVKFFIDASTKKFDLVFPVLHGPYGEDGKLQGMLDMIGMPYVFSGTLASALANDKYKTKAIVRGLEINTPKDILLHRNAKFEFKDIVTFLALPAIVKPLNLGSSLGISVIHTQEDLQPAFKAAWHYGDYVLIEEYIRGRELTVLVVGNKPPEAFPVVEIIPKKAQWYDFKSKYDPDGCEKICPAPLDDAIRDELQKKAVRIYKELGCKDLARIDFILSQEFNIPYFLDLNTIPGLSDTSLAPMAAKAEGINFNDLIERLVKGAMKHYHLDERFKAEEAAEERGGYV